MLGLAILGAQAAPPQHAPHLEQYLIPRTKEAAESAFLHGGHPYFVVRLVHYFPGPPKKHVLIRLLVLFVARVIVAHVVINVVDRVIDDITHLFSSVILAVVDGSSNRSGR